MKYCSHCGAQLDDEAIFCPKCGCAAERIPSHNYSNQYADNNHTGNYPNTNRGEMLSPLSIVGFVFAFLSPLVGLICSIVAYRSAAQESNLKSKSFSKSGIIVSAVFLGLEIVLGVVLGILVAVDIIYYPYYDYWYLF